MSEFGTRTDILRGAGAESILGRDSFQADWSSLMAQCPWATAFQTPGYVLTWYRTYQDRYEPSLVLCRDADGRLRGLLTLAVSKADGQLVAAGDYQAGYQVWICGPELGDVFPLQAIESIRQRFPGSQFSLRYLPANAPIAWLSNDAVKGLCLLEAHRRPLLRFGDGQELEASLKKGSNRSRLNRLQKLGPVEFKKITDLAGLEAHFAEIMAWHDVRHVAVSGLASFREDPLMKSFGLAMLSAPGLLHATALTVGGRLASAHLGACSSKEVELGLIVHNPWLAKHSPGKFHVYFLAKMLMTEGYEQLDLTPGGGAHYYKERFANAWDQVHTLTVYPTSLKRHVGTARASIKVAAQKTLDILHVTPNQARQYIGQLKRLRPSVVPAGLRLAGAWVSYAQETRFYRHQAGEFAEVAASEGIRRDCLEDLLSYHPTDVWSSRQDFMAQALQRIEEGQHIYTLVEDGELLHWAWLIERPNQECLERLFPGCSLTLPSALALDFCTAARARGRGLGMQCLGAMLRDVASTEDADNLVVAMRAGGDVSDAALKAAGFSCEASLLERRTLGRRRPRWSVHCETRAEQATVGPGKKRGHSRSIPAGR